MGSSQCNRWEHISRPSGPKTAWPVIYKCGRQGLQLQARTIPKRMANGSRAWSTAWVSVVCSSEHNTPLHIFPPLPWPRPLISQLSLCTSAPCWRQLTEPGPRLLRAWWVQKPLLTCNTSARVWYQQPHGEPFPLSILLCKPRCSIFSHNLGAPKSPLSFHYPRR